ncbi:hypothetical protein [Methanosarcina barkeri]|uniref:hypothetical protein n=1 Tax=Methanosarcina barkeri TaxID=2208 RepID=UPI001FB3AC9C|nr:hypothetical protein [Methanosarcina barkeri]
MLTVSPYRYRASVYRYGVHTRILLKEGFFEGSHRKNWQVPYLGGASASSSSIFSGSSLSMASAISNFLNQPEHGSLKSSLPVIMRIQFGHQPIFKKRLERKETIPVITHINLGHGSLKF